MAPESYELDPDGDVLLVLRNPRPPFAVWDKAQDYPSSLPDLSSLEFLGKASIEESAMRSKKKGKKGKKKRRSLFHGFEDGSPAATDEPQASIEEASVITEVESVQIRVSSHHLTLASPYHNSMLKGKWKEAVSLETKRCVEVEVNDIDADALVILMKIIHGKTRTVPKALNLEMLAKIAVIVDLYQCYEAVEVFTEMWIASLKETLPGAYSRDTVLWICISWVFQQHDEFYSATCTTLKYSNGPIQSLGLPILPRIVGK